MGLFGKSKIGNGLSLKEIRKLTKNCAKRPFL